MIYYNILYYDTKQSNMTHYLIHNDNERAQRDLGGAGRRRRPPPRAPAEDPGLMIKQTTMIMMMIITTY